jgi:hypothetical protein
VVSPAMKFADITHSCEGGGPSRLTTNKTAALHKLEGAAAVED